MKSEVSWWWGLALILAAVVGLSFETLVTHVNAGRLAGALLERAGGEVWTTTHTIRLLSPEGNSVIVGHYLTVTGRFWPYGVERWACYAVDVDGNRYDWIDWGWWDWDNGVWFVEFGPLPAGTYRVYAWARWPDGSESSDRRRVHVLGDGRWQVN